MTQKSGLTLTSEGGNRYEARVANGLCYVLEQENWSVKTDYYLDTFVYHLADILDNLRAGGNPLRRVLEMGIARGVLSIGVALLTEPDTTLVGVDIAPGADELVRKNAAQHGVAERISVRIGDMFEPIGEDEPFDLIISEMPFIPVDPTEQARLIDEGYGSEILNVSGGADGRYFIDIIITQAARYLAPGGAVVFIQPSFIGVEKSLQLLAEHGLKGEVLFQREHRLQDTRFTHSIKDYIEAVGKMRFAKNAQGEEVFHLTLIKGEKP